MHTPHIASGTTTTTTPTEGNNVADEGADFGRRRVDFPVIDARRNFAGVCGRRYLVILTLHRFLLLSLEGLLIMWMEMVLRLILWSVLLVLFRRNADQCMPCGIMLLLLPLLLWGLATLRWDPGLCACGRCQFCWFTPPMSTGIWASQVCPSLNTPFGRRSVGALSPWPSGSALASSKSTPFISWEMRETNLDNSVFFFGFLFFSTRMKSQLKTSPSKHTAQQTGLTSREEISEIGDPHQSPANSLPERTREKRARSSARNRNHTRPPTAPRQERGSSCAICSTNRNASSLHRPPVSMPQQSVDNLLSCKSSQHFVSLSRRALRRVAPLTVAELGVASPNEFNAHRSVMSTASWPPWFRGNPETRTSISLSSEAGMILKISMTKQGRQAKTAKHTM